MNTDVPDPNAPACFDFETCFVQHAWKWQKGAITDLGVLPDGYSSYTNAINSRGLIVGQSENGQFDPLTGAMVDLNTISSGSTLDLFEADFITDRGEIVARGFTSNGDVHTAILIPDGEAGETVSTVAPNLFTRSSDQSVRLTREVLQRIKKSMRKGLPPGGSR